MNAEEKGSKDILVVRVKNELKNYKDQPKVSPEVAFSDFGLDKHLFNDFSESYSYKFWMYYTNCYNKMVRQDLRVSTYSVLKKKYVQTLIEMGKKSVGTDILEEEIARNSAKIVKREQGRDERPDLVYARALEKAMNELYSK